ncbi:ABC transporter ATP-binding protein [Streptococcus panodentis]|uniref:ABC transporter ATP-binding protein n=1 Tax=Streptococcus panodentis TaxID=1581472 RepID=A0ABS5B0M9_9STRE|nr:MULTISPECIES: ATP-binding cassette domain-containing protein [Streptococcus]KXT85131.1 ABC transporter, ATP-binding protein [Streptococcus sp. DD11]MBP2622061.1 ABC transporter ATP-binding protein [Streptococcus panodentis]
MLKLEKICKKYDNKNIFRKVNFRASTGEIVLLTGESGIGKTTFLEIIAGLRKIDSGKYYYDNQEILCNDDDIMSGFRNKNIGYILQDFALVDDYTVLENIILPVLYSRFFSKEEAILRAKSFALKFYLEKELDKKVRFISGGQKQRVAIIRSLILNPEIILADEPTTNLDKNNFRLVLEMFQELKKQEKIIIIATHDDRIKKIADRSYKIVNQEIIESP